MMREPRVQAPTSLFPLFSHYGPNSNPYHLSIGINGHQTPPKQVGQTYADYGETSKFFQFTGLASEGGTGWQQTARPMQAKKWSITSSFYKRKYAYMFASGNAEGVVSRFNVQRTDLAEDASLSENSRKRRSLDFVKDSV